MTSAFARREIRGHVRRTPLTSQTGGLEVTECRVLNLSHLRLYSHLAAGTVLLQPGSLLHPGLRHAA